MNNILKRIALANRNLAILIDPEKMKVDAISAFAKAVMPTISTLENQLQIDQFYFLVGGSTMENVDFEKWIITLKENTHIPIVIFPGSSKQLSEDAHGILFLNLLSGRNPEYLVEQQLQAAQKLKNTSLEVLPTGYLLLDGGKETAVQRISRTKPLNQNQISTIVNHAYAAQLMGNRLIYLEAGSGATHPVSAEIVHEVSKQINIPLIVGGGLRTMHQIEETFNAGAKMVVIGTAIEEDISWNG
ncbi:putative glycerol-1-phosphate prenyltransferase [Nonlabens dokdonensis]|jgi:putative glycerol-1-phosphate prenyltransferase|uniref:Geranylgeranylglyceryl phosphate synthase n=2 Tax=Nonlabens dokdonensis TaxID=328515 RepID=L7W901_NONDD|nr:geranylgeranylglyceryl/heptaprenylglyceryl phosphate synthase [Nonlabens dokdonensis]AGC76644.1 putative PcrB family protein [Nonlabens dokdonensis DSW-6]PZX44293.1 putative glycerol-1-phosphate prenyltransferase [Nonlabens dokdonensis]